MEENTNSTIPFYFPKEYKSIVSIIGIGGGAGRIVAYSGGYPFSISGDIRSVPS